MFRNFSLTAFTKHINLNHVLVGNAALGGILFGGDDGQPLRSLSLLNRCGGLHPGFSLGTGGFSSKARAFALSDRDRCFLLGHFGLALGLSQIN